MDVRSMPLNAEEAAKAARGELWLAMDGSLGENWMPPRTLPTYVPLGEVRGNVIGRRVLWQRENGSHERGLYVTTAPALGSQIPGAPNPTAVYVRLVGERMWWSHDLLGAKISGGRWAAINRVWLDEAEDPTPR
jgi:hypothetical protein